MSEIYTKSVELKLYAVGRGRRVTEGKGTEEAVPVVWLFVREGGH